MKKVFMILFFLGSMGILDAQNKEVEDNPKKAKLDLLEIILGADAATLTGNSPDFSNVFGVQTGIQIPVAKLSDNVGLGLGAIYSMQGGKYKSYEYIPGGDYGNSSATSRLNYLNFPVLARYQKQRQGFFAEAGVQPGVLLSAKNKGENIKDNLKKFDVGIPIGVGYQFKNKFGVGLRFTPGLLNINKDEQYKTRNMVTSLRASYAL
ncbi:MAG: porin family protein [Ferruginibacter sp.]